MSSATIVLVGGRPVHFWRACFKVQYLQTGKNICVDWRSCAELYIQHVVTAGFTSTSYAALPTPGYLFDSDESVPLQYLSALTWYI